MRVKLTKNAVLSGVFLVGIYIITIAACATAFLFYKGYLQRNEDLRKEDAAAGEKIKSLENATAGIRNEIEKLFLRFDKYDEDLSAVQVKFKADQSRMQDMSSRLDQLSLDAQAQQKDFLKAIAEINEKIGAIRETTGKIDREIIPGLQADVEKIKSGIKAESVDSALDSRDKEAARPAN